MILKTKRYRYKNMMDYCMLSHDTKLDILSR